MSHKDGRVVLSAWVEPVLRDYAREAAKAACIEFSRWVEGAVQRAVAEQSAAKALRTYPVHASNLTDVVTLLENERDEARAEVERLRAEAAAWRATAADKGYSSREVAKERDTLREEIARLRAERRQLRARLVECRPWVGVCPFPNTAGFSEMLAIRDLADDTIAEVKP